MSDLYSFGIGSRREYVTRIALSCLCVLLAGTCHSQTDKPSATPLLPATVSWVGNNWNGHDHWVPMAVTDLCVTPEGTLFTNTAWEEGGENVVEIRSGKITQVAGHTHGWGYEGGNAITANSRYLFIAQTVNNEGGGLKGTSWPTKGSGWAGVSRRLRSDIRQPAPFSGGIGKEGDVLPGAFCRMAEFPDDRPVSIEGLAANESDLFVAIPGTGMLYDYDVETMTPRHALSLRGVRRLTVQGGFLLGLLDPLTPGGPYRVFRLDTRRFASPEVFDFPKGVIPTDIAAKPEAFWITDTGPSMQAICYRFAGKTLQATQTLGKPGGLFAPPTGRIGVLRFNTPQAIGLDTAGRIYVVHGGQGGNVMEAYDANAKRLWRLYGLTFVDLADADPGTDFAIFTKLWRFRFISGGEPGQDSEPVAYTLDPKRYPDDPRLHLDSTYTLIRRLNGVRIQFVNEMVGGALQVFRFTSQNDTAIPCGLFLNRPTGRAYPPGQPGSGAIRWEDRNANGRIDSAEWESGPATEGVFWPDARGTIWQADGMRVRWIPYAGLGHNGVPHWSLAKTETREVPVGDFDSVRRVRYLSETDTLLLAGNQGNNHNQHWKPMGPVLARYDGWQRGKSVCTWHVLLPLITGSAGHESEEPISFDVAGDYVFVAYTRGLPQDHLRNAFIKVLRLSDGSVVGNLSSEAITGEIGLLDLVESVRAVKRPEGEYLVFLEDDARSKVVLFRWRP